MDRPAISVIVPTYNRPDYLKLTLDSLAEQVFTEPFEVVVVNDCGQDVNDIVASYGNKLSLVYTSHDQNRGLAASRNTGIARSHANFIAFLDDDDVYYPIHLSTLHENMSRRNLDIAYTDAFKASGYLQGGKFVTESRVLEYSKDFDRNEILLQNFVPVLCYMCSRRALDKVGGFDETFEVFEDWDLLGIRMSKYYLHQHIKVPTAEYRWHADSPNMSGVSSRPPNFFRDYFAKMYLKHIDRGSDATIAYRKKWLINQGWTFERVGDVPPKAKRRRR